MKRRDLIAHLEDQGCVLHHEGAKHSVVVNPENGHATTVPRHREIDIILARKICRQLDVPLPKARLSSGKVLSSRHSVPEADT